MTELTVFSVPKAMTGEFVGIQTNAVRSWKALGVTEIVLLGDDEGVEQFAEDEDVTRGGAVERNEYGTPLLDSIFELGEAIAQTELVCYVNADIILFPDFIWALELCADVLPHFLMCGQRFDTSFPFTAQGLTPERDYVYRQQAQYGKRIGVGAADYFAYRKGDMGEIPPFALGAFRWDNFLMYRALERGLAFVDATEAVFAIHQNHAPKPRVDGDLERIGNDQLVSQNGGTLGRLTDATHSLTEDFRLVERARA